MRYLTTRPGWEARRIRRTRSTRIGRVDAPTGITSRGTADPVTAAIAVPNRITDLGVVAIPIQ
jgi:hypothetical protein